MGQGIDRHGLGQAEPGGAHGPPVGHRLRQARLQMRREAETGEMIGLGRPAHREDQPERRQRCEQRVVPGGRAFPPRRQVASRRILPGKAEAHGAMAMRVAS